MPPPFNRTVALACTLDTVRTRWLDVRCACNDATPHPIRLMLTQNPALARQTPADRRNLGGPQLTEAERPQPAETRHIRRRVHRPDGTA